MKKSFAFKILSVCLAAFALCSLLASCSERRRGETMMSLGEKTLGVNTYEFLLSRMKGTLSYYGYNVGDDRFWNTTVSFDGTTYDDYFCATIRQEASRYLVADHLFDLEGLVLDAEKEAEIDEVMQKKLNAAGSKAKLNSTLKEYGVNYEMLREIYVTEAKMLMLQEHLYGSDGERISDADKQSYLDDNYVSFKQIFLATYDYVRDTDRFGDTVYYTDDKRAEIAYDIENGVTKTDENGKVIKDEFKNPEYYTADGKIAYDVKNGVIGYETDDDGNKVIFDLSDSKKGEIYANATKYAEACNGNEALFDEYAELYNETESSGRMYLYSSAGYYAAQNDAAAYFDEIAKALEGMDVGECAVYRSDYGCHVIYKCENESGAYGKKEYEDAFADFNDNIITYLFNALCAEYEKDITVDESVAADAANMKTIGVNVLY